MSKLTPRLYDIGELLQLGLSNKEIGKRLDISDRTVKSHLVRLYDALGVRNRTAAAVKFGQGGNA